MKIIQCALCGKQLGITRPGEPPVPGTVHVDEAERQGWGASSDGKILCRWHAPVSRIVKLRDVVEHLVRDGKL